MLNDFCVTITGLYNRNSDVFPLSLLVLWGSIYMLGEGPNDLNLLACTLLENTLIGVCDSR